MENIALTYEDGSKEEFGGGVVHRNSSVSIFLFIGGKG
jgi:hypothetical protein